MATFLRLSLLAQLAVSHDPTFVFTEIRADEPLCFSGHHSQDYDGMSVFYSLKGPQGNSVSLMGCEVTKNQYMANGDFMPLSAQSHLPSMVRCEVDVDQLDSWTSYQLVWTNDQGNELAASDTLHKGEGASRYPTESCFKTVTDMELDRQISRSEGRKARMGRAAVKQSITSITPRHASPMGGAFITIFGTGLKSQKLDISGVVDESEDQGENFKVWFTHTHEPDVYPDVICDVDRMFGLHVKPLIGQDWLVCRTRPMGNWGHYNIRVQIDDGQIHYHWHIYFGQGYGPVIKYFRPAAASPAKAAATNDFQGEFVSKWFDADSDMTDGVEDEGFARHFGENREFFQSCFNPLAIEVMVKSNNEMFIASTNENADGYLIPVTNNAQEGFKCQDTDQTVEGMTCPDVKVRYRCLQGLVQLEGQIFTDIHGRMDHPEFHVNRLMETPLLESEDGFKSDAKIFLNDGENCGSHANCGLNTRLPLKVVGGGNDGIIQFVANAPIPGAYNFTFTTFYQGHSSNNRRLISYMNSEDLYTNNYEVYPQINSVEPQMGSVAGGTKLTIKGSGFVEDGLGGVVTVKVGEDDCEVESMTETQIICRTVGGAEEPVSFSSRTFTVFDPRGLSSSDNHRNHWLATDMKTVGECKARCVYDATCQAYIFRTVSEVSSGCWHIDDLQVAFDASDEDQMTSMLEHWSEYPITDSDSESGYIKNSDQQVETDCYTGRGRFYQGDAAVTDGGTSCATGTFCRNTDGEQLVPTCVDENDDVKRCNILRCDEKWGKFGGNRGAIVEFQDREVDINSLEFQESGRTFGNQWRNLDGFISKSKYNSLFLGDAADYYSTKSRTYFVAPYEGYFSFALSGDDGHKLSIPLDMTTGLFENPTEHSAACTNTYTGCSKSDISPVYFLNKGEQFPIQATQEEGTGGDYVQISAMFHGKTESGTWIDNRKKSDFVQDVYAYDSQRIHLLGDIAYDYIWINLPYNLDFLENPDNYLQTGETKDYKQRAQFRLKWCGDDNNCFTTENIDIRNKNHESSNKVGLEYQLRQMSQTTCTKSGTMSPEHYHGDYEDSSKDWPGRWHWNKGAGHWCGYHNHEVHNHDIWNTNLGKKFSTSQSDDICFAYKGNINEFAVTAKFHYDDAEGDEQEWKGWLVKKVGWTSTTWKWTCFKISETLISGGKYYSHTVKDEVIFDITNIRLQNAEYSPIYIDELRIGRMRSSLKMVQTKKALTFDGQVARSFSVWEHSSGYGSIVKIHVDNWDSTTNCGFIVTLPTILPAEGNFDYTGSTSMSSGSDWTAQNNPAYLEPYSGFNLAAISEDAPKDYRYVQHNYVDTSSMVRSVNEIWVLRGQQSVEAAAGDFVISYGNDPNTLSMRLDGSVYPLHLTEKLVETWPSLGATGLNIKVGRSGWCHTGYEYEITSQEHGNMDKLTVTATAVNSRMVNPKFGIKYQVNSGVVTEILPGSVMATAHHVPQVVISSNGQRSACDNCDFEYRNNLTPEVISISPDSGALAVDDVISIQFNVKAYMGNFDNTVIALGGVSLKDCGAFTNVEGVVSVDCKVGYSGFGSGHELTFDIPELGTFKHDKTYELELTIGSLLPSTGSKNGGTIVVVSGSGFKPDSTIQINFGGVQTDCDSTGLEVTFDSMTCRTAPNSGISGGVTPTVSWSQNKFTVIGGEMFTLTGTDLSGDDSCNSVMIGDNQVKTDSWSNTEITGTTANMAPGNVDLKVYVCPHGYADVVSGQVQLKINSVSHAFSSLGGSNELTIAGSTFGHDARAADSVAVKVGNIPCEITEMDYNEIKCKTGAHNNRVEVRVTANGFKFTDNTPADEIVVEEGQEILFTWMISIPGTVPIIELQEVVNGEITTDNDRRKWTEPMAGNSGKFLRRFTSKRRYYISTGLIDSAYTAATTSILVVDAVDKPYKLSVMVDGHEAIHMGNSNNNQPTGTCRAFGTSTAAAPTESGFFVTYSWAETPVINSYSTSNPSVDGLDGLDSPTTTIKMYFNDDNNFAPQDCSDNVVITVGDYPCINTEGGASSTRQTCVLDPEAMLDITKVHRINGNIKNAGDAIYLEYSYDAETSEFMLDSHRGLSFAPYVTAMTPRKFSRMGDVDMTIDGTGFVSELPTTVLFRNGLQTFDCKISSITYNQINCHMVKIASSLKFEDSDFAGFIKIGETEFSMRTDPYESQDAYTPKVTQMYPLMISNAGEEFTVKGSRLEELVVTIGGKLCVVTSASDRTIRCTVPDLSAGRHKVQLKGQYGGISSAKYMVVSELAAASLSPSAGGLNGGSLVTVTGFGFNVDTVIEVYQKNGARLCEFCKVHSIPSASELVFYSPRVLSAQTVDVIVKHEFLASSIAALEFVYSDSSPAIASASIDLTDLEGAETMVITAATNFGACENIQVEVVIANDPCAVGQHECDPTRAHCTSTADGLDYTCACKDLSLDLFNGEPWCDAYCILFKSHGAGNDCFDVFRTGLETLDTAEDACNPSEARYILHVQNDYDEDNLKGVMTNVEGVNSRGVFVKWYGAVTCIRGQNNVFTGEFELWVEPDSSLCNTWGRESDRDYSKRVLCRHYPNRNCFDHTLTDNAGKHSYNGRKSTTITGRKCEPWTDTSWWGQRKDLIMDDSQCLTTWNNAEGPFCYVGKAMLDGTSETRESCGIPTCANLAAGTPRQECTIATARKRDPDAYIYTWEGDTFDLDNGKLHLFDDNDLRVHSPLRAYHNARHPSSPFRFEAVDEANDIYRVIRRKYNGEQDSQRYLYLDPLNEDSDRRVQYTKTVEDHTSAKTEIVVEENTFHEGYFTLRQGEYFLYVSKSNAWMSVVHQDDVHNQDDMLGFSWKIECTSEDYGLLIDQPKVPYKSVHVETGKSCGSGNEINFAVPDLQAGDYKVILRSSEYGAVKNVLDLTYGLKLEDIMPKKVGTGGGSILTMIGQGFGDGSQVSATLCGTDLVRVENSFVAGVVEKLSFMTVPFEASNCADGVVLTTVNRATGEILTTANDRKRRALGDFEIDESITPTVTNVMPKMGGTMGGTTLTIDGTGFGTVVADADVTVMGTVCDVQTVTDSQITCVTNAMPRDQPQVKVTPVVIIDNGPGTAIPDETDNHLFWYVDRWSSPYTWGCVDDSCKPKAGEIIVIPAGQVILLDETTPILAVLIIDGGTMIWDRTGGIELHMQYGVVNSGGYFQIGTEEEPFCHGTALIKLYGHQRSINLPIYGAKVLAVRFGSIDIHGCPKTTTWTELDVTAEEGDTQITLTHPVVDDWFVDDFVIIAATGDLTNFHRSEKMQISAVSADGYTVTLTEPLKHRHFAVCSNGPNDSGIGWGWKGVVCTRAEVGLLTRNVKMMGNINNQWTEELPECAAGPGTAFGTQTCFQNRFGHETGSDQFGSVLFIHKPTYAKIEFFEVTHAGQAFNLARYPIHFHTPGSLPDSYVRGCGIHNTFNRALTLHGVHDLLVEYNVIYNVMGLAFFMEDAVEENNILRYNLGIMNKKSSSLLNVDSTPAVFWITNPNNIFYGNRAAASSHFGFWFNPPEDGPTGPSAKDPQYADICPKNRPLGAFYNNTAHSMGKYGLWIFTDLTPTGPNGDCGETTPRAAKFGHLPEIDIEGNAVPKDTPGFFAWHCERGAEIATGGALQFHNFVVANNWIAGLAGKESFLNTYADGEFLDQSQLFKRNIVIGHLGGDKELDACGDMGLETPWKLFAFTVDDIHFFNYDKPTPDKGSNIVGFEGLASRRCLAFDPCYGSNAFDCGAVTWFNDVKWYNSPRRTNFVWEHEAAIYDRDGSFGGKTDSYIIASSNTFNTNLCSEDNSGKYDGNSNTDPDMNGHGHGAMICLAEKDGARFKPHRFMFNQATPESVEGTMARFTNEFGFTRSPFRNCRPRGRGWMVMLNGETEYSMYFENYDHISNISYFGDIDDFEADNWITIKHDFPEKIDFAMMNGNDDVPGEKLENWEANPLNMNAYDYHVENVTQPYTVKYTFNGMANSENPQLSGAAYSWGQDFFVHPEFHKCFYKDCIMPEPEPPTAPPALVDCNFLDCYGDVAPEDWSEIHVMTAQKMIIDAAAVTNAGGHMKFSGVFVDGTLEVRADSIGAGETLIIEADHLVTNTGEGDNQDNLSRRRRDTMFVSNGAIIIGTAENPIPCDRKVIIKINGDKNARSFGAMPGSIPIGAKALGGLGGIQMHGCEITTTWTSLTNTLEVGTDSITVDGDVSEWKVGDEIAIATTDYEQRHTEYFAITAKNGQELSLNATAAYKHLGTSTTTQEKLGRSFDQGAEVALLTRNIVIDGSGGAESKVGGRILITGATEENNGHDYIREGYGQFSFVELKGMGQHGYTNYDDLRAQIVFYDVNVAGDLDNGILPSYVRGCAFHAGFHTAVAAMFNSDGLEISNNVIFGLTGSAIRTDSIGLSITDNVIGNVYNSQLWGEYVEGVLNTNFADDKMPSGIDTSESTDGDSIVITGNRVAGVDGSCYAGDGVSCEGTEACTGNQVSSPNVANNRGHGCLRGYYILHGGHSACTKISGFVFTKILYFGVTTQSRTMSMVIDDVIIEDSTVGVFAIQAGPDSTMHEYADTTVTIKNSFISGKGASTFDCDYDQDVQNNVYSDKFTGRQRPPPNRTGSRTAIISSDFLLGKNGFPACAWTAHDLDVAVNGITCVINTEIANYNEDCEDDREVVVTGNMETLDHIFPVHFMTGNTMSNVGENQKIDIGRPDIKFVNIADCSDLYCDTWKKFMIIDDSGMFYGEAGTLLPESEYEWDGVTRVQPDGTTVTYSDQRDGLGDYRIPAPMKTKKNGNPIPMNQVFSETGIFRNENCVWKNTIPGWWCPKSTGVDELKYFDLVYENMDADFQRRRLTPLAVRADKTHVDIINGPGDHSCCIGYACFIRLSTIHTTVACGKDYDYFFSSTNPMSARFHFTQAPADCKVKISMYTKRPNRLDLKMNGEFVVATNGEMDGENVKWEKPDVSIHMPNIDSHNSGQNFFDRDAQMFHFIMSGGNLYELDVVQTLILELDVMTELTDDEFYDNGNLANNLAALLGIDPSKIRIMNVIREDSDRKRRRRALAGMLEYSMNDFRFRRNTGDAASTLAIEITPDNQSSSGVKAINKLGESIVSAAADLAAVVGESLGVEVSAEIAVAKAPEKPEEPETAVPLTELLGLDEITPEQSENSAEFLEMINEKLKEIGSSLDDLTTAEETAEEAQNIKDSAEEPIIYVNPKFMLLKQQPTENQMAGSTMTTPIVVEMYGDDDELMLNVGFVANPWTVSIFLSDLETFEGESANIDGESTATFMPAIGTATFSGLIVNGVKSCTFTLTVSNPSDSTVLNIKTGTINFIPPIEPGECVEREGAPFDKAETWSATCDNVCLQDCESGGSSILGATAPVCNDVTTCDGGEASTFAKCGETGCECDMDSVPSAQNINPGDYITAKCDGSSMEIRINKCIMNEFGFRLADLYLHGKDATENFTELETSVDNTCRGVIQYDMGPEYVFKIDRTFSDCRTAVVYNETHASYENAIQGSYGQNNGVISRMRNFFVGFGCTFPIDLTTSLNLGEVGSQSTELSLTTVVGTFSVSMAVFTDDSYLSVAGSDFEVTVPDHIHVGIVLDEGQFIVQARKCWVTPDNNPENAIQYPIIEDSCANDDDADNIAIIENGETSQSRFSFAAFHFLGVSESSELFMHCEVHICNSASAADCNASCDRRRRSGRSRRDATDTNIVSVGVKMNMSKGIALCEQHTECAECVPLYNGYICDGNTVEVALSRSEAITSGK